MKETSREISGLREDCGGLLARTRHLPVEVRVKLFSQTLVVASLAEAARLGEELVLTAPEVLNEVDSPGRVGWRGRWKSWYAPSRPTVRAEWFAAAVRSWARFAPDTRSAMLVAASGRPEWGDAARD